MTRFKLPVSCKAIIFNEDGSKVLVAYYRPDMDYGLPGGHIEALGETPEQAIERELDEEVGLTGLDLRRFDFYLHKDGKIALLFVGQIAESTPLQIDYEEISDMIWLGVDKLSDETIVGGYTPFVRRAVDKLLMGVSATAERIG